MVVFISMPMSKNLNEPISLEDIQRAYGIAARVIKDFGDVYLPIFQRLHEELAERKKQLDMKAVALSVADNSPCQNPPCDNN
jgi:hypothetical protein